MNSTPSDWPQLFALFERVSDAPADERARLLDEACRDQPAVRPRIERLLALDACASDLVADVAGWREQLVGAGPDGALPSRIGAWEVVRELGAGGMGRVFLAERADGEYEQQVALKVIRGEFASDIAIARFLAERRILARLDHPGIAGLVDGGVDACGRPWFAMQYVEGAPLNEYCTSHALGVEARLELVIAICEAVAYAHRQFVVHCDLKPSNVLVDRNGQPRLLDFGIARLLGTGHAPHATQTQARALTPGYAAPEQLAGKPVGISSDVYALGVMLHELLVGTRPYALADDTPVALAVAQARGEPPPPSRAATAASPLSARRLRGDLDQIVIKALRHDPALRYADADALAEDVRRHLAGFPLRAQRDSAVQRSRKFVLRHRAAVTLAAFATLALFATTLFALLQMRAAREQATRAEAVREFLVGVFEQANPDRNHGQPLTAQQLLDKGETELAADIPRTPAIQTDLTSLIGSLYWDIGDYAHAEPLLQHAVVDSAGPQVPADVKARSLLALARAELEKNLYDSAATHVRQALVFAQAAGRSGAQSASTARRLLARAQIGQDRAADAEPALRAALAMDRAQFGPRSAASLDDMLLLAFALKELSRNDEAIATAHEAIALATSLHGRIHSSVLDGLETLASAQGHSGDTGGAEKSLREAADIAARIYGADHRETIVARSNLYLALAQAGRYAEARDGHLALLDTVRKIGARRPEQLAYTWNALAADYRGTGQFAEAASAAREALAVWTKIHGADDSPDSFDAMANLGVALTMQGRYADAEATLRHLVASESRVEPASSLWLAKDRAYLGDALRLDHRSSEAAGELRNALAAIGTAAATPSPIVIFLRSALSQADLELGEPAQARSQARATLEIARHGLASGNATIAAPLFALARADLALGQARDAEPLLREALALRRRLFSAGDPRVLEVETGLVAAMTALGQSAEATALRRDLEPRLQALATPYAADLIRRLDH